MTAMETIWEIEDLGGSLSAQGGRVRLSARVPLPKSLVDALRRQEAKVRSIISAPRSDRSDWQALFGECLELTLEREAATRADKAKTLILTFIRGCVKLNLERDATIRSAQGLVLALFGECVELFLERNATIPLDEAESLALKWCVTVWEIRNPAPSSPESCVWCEKPDDTCLGTVLPFFTGSSGHTWLHHQCWQTWSKRREAEAADALAQMGVAAPKYADTDSTLGAIPDVVSR